MFVWNKAKMSFSKKTFAQNCYYVKQSATHSSAIRSVSLFVQIIQNKFQVWFPIISALDPTVQRASKTGSGCRQNNLCFFIQQAESPGAQLRWDIWSERPSCNVTSARRTNISCVTSKLTTIACTRLTSCAIYSIYNSTIKRLGADFICRLFRWLSKRKCFKNAVHNQLKHSSCVNVRSKRSV